MIAAILIFSSMCHKRFVEALKTQVKKIQWKFTGPECHLRVDENITVQTISSRLRCFYMAASSVERQSMSSNMFNNFTEIEFNAHEIH